MTIFSPIVGCAEVHGSRKEDVNEDNTVCTVQLRCPWANRFTLAADLLTNRRAWPDLSGWSRPPRAISVGIVPLLSMGVALNQSFIYEDALVNVTYSTKFQDAIIEELEPLSEFTVLDFKRFRWTAKDGDPLLENEAPGKLVRGMALSRTILNVTPPLPTVLRDGVGSVNDTSYTSTALGITFEAEELMLGQPKITRNVRSDGTSTFSVAMKLAFRKNGWNKYWRAKTETYEEIFDVDNNAPYKSYPLVDMSDILT